MTRVSLERVLTGRRTACRYSVATLLLIFVLLAWSAAQRPVRAETRDSATMFSRTASMTLARDFSSHDISYLLYDEHEDNFIASQWPDSDRLVSVGSLVKPFVALAYAESHGFRYPRHTCAGGDSCWLPKGHGELDLARAIAVSCNAYFTELASSVGGAQVTSVAQSFGLTGPGANATPEAIAGKFGIWREAPQAMVRAFATLFERATQPGVRDIVDGMKQSAMNGTAAGIARQKLQQSFLAKTGTAPCTHREHAPGDGFVLVAWPADFPRYVLLVRQHGVPGAQASVLAGRMLRALEPQP